MAAPTQKNNKPGKSGGKESQPLVIAKTPAEEQRLKLERLMRNPDKLAPIPDRPKEWNPRAPPEFVRDVMGSSAGAGSGEFHVYRHLRRREYQRQDFLDKMAEHTNKDEEYLEKVEQNRQEAEERTAKRRRKRDKLKQKKLKAKKAKEETKTEDSKEKSESSEEEEEEEGGAEDDAETPSFIMGRK
ncbi:PRKR-interacting protein 1 homolog [Xyrichtys novacula]|uniref:PRKR-interacting protein 1 homolog n=1 Tax=Xyrichtys novacula TaxID=13765 RepID=A0AAV1GVK2_XYRNO|nr:PRKR-interacting protein 1 homolog [Xyrichtys novacula]